MSIDPAQQIACRTCGRLLNRYLDLDTGQAHYTHPTSERADHDPDPVPADQIDTHHVCDFCSDDKIVYTFRVNPVEMVVIADTEQLIQRYGSNWSACIECADLVQARDVPRLSARIMRAGVPFDPQVIDNLHTMQQAVVDSVLPGRALATIGHWQPTPLPAPILPKIRDRLAQLIRSHDELPLGLNNTDLRDQLAASLDAARLYWIDREFTELTTHAAASLPTTTVTAADAPAPHGLIAWAQPVGHRADLTAATWTTNPDGIRIICYRSIGTGLSAGPLQRLREQVGWLLPHYTTHLRPDDVIDTTSPASAVIATWLLIGQKLTETTTVTADKAIRKAYQRTGRPAPEVRLVRIRGTATTANTHTDRQPTNQPGREHQYRWWVRGHWRNQPYGPGRTQRRLIYLDPQIRGPEDKPIKASTTVRILGTTRRNGTEHS
ncbi:hypothetical protein QQG74_21570 [Micromonospora sp. FIMYZ51]|uniref:hypothetical protein n=1 Tax=Micromonospora sp. FIMYZ51 TaxID=3051832 RepID=UPI0031202341